MVGNEGDEDEPETELWNCSLNEGVKYGPPFLCIIIIGAFSRGFGGWQWHLRKVRKCRTRSYIGALIGLAPRFAFAE